jgi:DNA polymerase-3 subunit beta
MKLSVLQENLLSKLNIASRFVSSRAQLPVLLNFLLSAKLGKLKIAATNLESGISTTVGAKIEKEGEITVPARIFLELISNISPGKIDLEEERGQLKISNSSFSGTVTALPAAEFPSLPDLPAEKSFLLSKETIEILAKQVAFCAGQDETRPVLTGILLVLGEQSLAVATDGFRLSYKELNTRSKEMEQKKVLVPARIIDELVKIQNNEDGDVLVAVKEKEGQLVFGIDETVLVARLIEGDFPPYEKVIPSSWNTRIICSREEIARGVRTASVFAKVGGNIVKMETEQGSIVLSSESSEYGKEKITIDAKTEGEEIEIAFNYKFLIDFLASVDGETISIEMQNSNSPAVFQDIKDTSYKHIIMPIRLQEI